MLSYLKRDRGIAKYYLFSIIKLVWVSYKSCNGFKVVKPINIGM